MDKFEHQLITTTEQLIDLLEDIDYTRRVVLDTESTGLGWYDTLLGITIYQKGSVLPSFVVRRTPFFQGVGIPLEDIQKIFRKYIPKMQTVWHNATYDLGVFDANSFPEPNVVFDTLLAIHLYDADLKKQLETRVVEDFGYRKQTFKALIGMNWDKIVWDANTWQIFTLETLAEYAAEDGYWTWELMEKYEPLLDQMNVRKVLDKIEIPLCYVLKDMKKHGVAINVPLLEDLKVKCAKGIKDLEAEIHESAGCVFNINSGKQKAEVLYDKLDLPVYGTTKGGARATDKKALEKIYANTGAEIAQKLLEYSKLQKLQSGYIVAIPRMIDHDGRLRCNFSSVGAQTGRFSSSNPNLQNQPNDKSGKYPVRKAFVAAPGHKLIIADWSQIEYRMTAHLSQDEKLMAAFFAGRDIHSEVAESMGIDRGDAKKVNFGIIYGLGADSLGLQIKKRKEIAQKYLDDYVRTYPGVAHWKDRVEKKAQRDGYVRTIFGRIRPIRNVHSKDRGEFFRGLRQAVNTVVQGACADMMKLGLIRVHEYIKKHNIPAKILLTVHDEIMIECRDEWCEKMYIATKHIFENLVALSVPIVAEGKICSDWSQMKDDDFKGLKVGRSKVLLTSSILRR